MDFNGFINTKDGLAELQYNIILKTIKHFVAHCLGHLVIGY